MVVSHESSRPLKDSSCAVVPMVKRSAAHKKTLPASTRQISPSQSRYWYLHIHFSVHQVIKMQSRLLLLSFAVSTRGMSLTKRACGETAVHTCFGGANGGTAQNINVDDISYAASYLRYLADTNGANPLWTMPPEFDCSEWGLPIADAGTVLVLTKHIKPRTNSSVSYYDLARTIDGGIDATPAQLAESLLGACGSAGGMMGVTVNADDAAYKTPGYLASKAKPQDMILKLVRAPA